MDSKGRLNQSEYGSIRVMGGDVYDASLRLVYVPLSAEELQNVLKLVNQEERRNNRRLTFAELDKLLC